MNKEELKILIELVYPLFKEQLKWYFIGFGILFGLLLFAWGMYVLGGLQTKCLCEKTNIATFLNENLDRNCVEFAEKGYRLEAENVNYLKLVDVLQQEDKNGFNAGFDFNNS